MSSLQGKDLVTSQDWSIEEISATIQLAEKFKQIRKKVKSLPKILESKIFFMLFWAPSTRTRSAFEAATELLGGHGAFIDAATTRITKDEALKDLVQMYDIYGDGLGVRILDETIDFVYGQGRRLIEDIARIAKIPVINMGCCTYHPTQALGDIITLKRKLGKLQGRKYAITWAYSSKLRGRCSIQEEALIATRFGMDVVLAHPPGFDIDPKICLEAEDNAKHSGGSFTVSHEFEDALRGAHVAFPRSWITSKMCEIGATAFGREQELSIHERYKNWRLEQRHVDDLLAKKAILTHVLPVHREEEATDEVIDGPKSVVYEQAEDNFYAKMAVLSLVLSSGARI